MAGLSLGLALITYIIFVVGAALFEPEIILSVLILMAPWVLVGAVVVLVVTLVAFWVIDRLVGPARSATWLGAGVFVLAWAWFFGMGLGGESENPFLVALILGGEALLYVLAVLWISSRRDRSRRRSDAEVTH